MSANVDGATLADRITAVRAALTRSDEAISVEQVSRCFKGARRSAVEAILGSRSALGARRRSTQGRVGAGCERGGGVIERSGVREAE